MRRRFRELVSTEAMRHGKYLVPIMRLVKDWPFLLLDYMGVTNKGRTYRLRSGLKITTVDGISSSTIVIVFMKKDYGEIPLPNSTVIDIGANIGVYSLYASQAQGTKVYAFEPMPKNFTMLQQNIKQNGLEKQIFAFPMAVSGKKETRELFLGSSPAHSFLPMKEAPFHAKFENPEPQDSIQVPCISLQDVFDTYHIDTCDVLKLDCEGAEYDILYNISAEYYNRIAQIRMEYHNHLGNKRNTGFALIEFLQRQGFQVVKSKKGSEYQGDVWLKRI